MRICRSFAVTAALTIAALYCTATSRAEPLDSVFDTYSDLGQSNRGAIGSWQTTVIPSLAVSARDPAWSTTIAALSPRPLTAGSVARVEPRPILPGPRLTGNGHDLAGNASFYSEEQMTATGEQFDKRGLTAAHRTLPFGTRVRVTRVDTGSSIIVRINDRGPFKPGRVIDLSERAAESLNMTSAGISPVRLEVLGQ